MRIDGGGGGGGGKKKTNLLGGGGGGYEKLRISIVEGVVVNSAETD